MASSMNEANFEKRLQNLTNTQESIQTLSLWCMHHKSHFKKIIDVWVKVMKKAKVSHRLALLYLANDVIQNSKRKGFGQFTEAFMPAIKIAAPLVREDKIRTQVERIFAIWNDRNVYDSQFITEIHSLMASTKSNVVANAKLLAEFKPQKLVDKIRKYKKLEAEVESKRKQFIALKIDVCNTETLKQLKDKALGTKFTKEFDDATMKLEEFVAIQQQELKEKTSLIEYLEQSEIFYETQKKEAKIVANAYKNFGTRVKNLHAKLSESIANLPTPVPSPTLDAPSPVDSSDGEAPKKDGTKDNIEAVDMEMSDEDCETTGKEADKTTSVPSPGSAPSPEGSPVGLNLSPPKSSGSSHSTPKDLKHANASPSKPSSKRLKTSALTRATGISTATSKSSAGAKATVSSMFERISNASAKTAASSLDIRLSNLMQNIPNFTSNLFGHRQLEGGNAAATGGGVSGEGSGTPLKDEESGTGSATPLQDESREASASIKCDENGGSALKQHDFNVYTTASFIGGRDLRIQQLKSSSSDDRSSLELDSVNAVCLPPVLVSSPKVGTVIEHDCAESGEKGVQEGSSSHTAFAKWAPEIKASFALQQPKEDSATPTINDILQKLVSSGTGIPTSNQNWNSPSSSGQQPLQTWFSQSQQPSMNVGKLRPPPPFAEFASLSQNSQFGEAGTVASQSRSSARLLPTSQPFRYNVGGSHPVGQFASTLNGDSSQKLQSTAAGGGGMSQANPMKISVAPHGQPYRRNSNIVELTPSPTTDTASFEGGGTSSDACGNPNLIPLGVRNTGVKPNGGGGRPELKALELNAKFGATAKLLPGHRPVNRVGGPPVIPGAPLGGMPSMTKCGGDAPGGNGEHYGGAGEIDNCHSNLRTIVPLGQPGTPNENARGRLSDAANATSPTSKPDLQGSYSKIETVDSRRESTEAMPGMTDQWDTSGNQIDQFQYPTEDLSPNWHPVRPHIIQSVVRREGPPYPPQPHPPPARIGFRFPRRGGAPPRGQWNPVGPPPKRPIMPPMIRPNRWAFNPPPY